MTASSVDQMLDSNGDPIRAGDRLIWGTRGDDDHIGRVEADVRWTGGLKVNGRSLKSVLEECRWCQRVPPLALNRF